MPLDHAPDFALSFTTDAVQLLQRKNHVEWQTLGQAEFSSSNFRADLAELRSLTGHDRSGPLPVVLLIPHDQILYTSLQVPGGPSREVEVARALDGLTPYGIEELAFDWKDEGDEVRVAAVARQTLAEAQEFALRHGFLGQGYSAQPSDGEYPGAPVFDVDAAPIIIDETATDPVFDSEFDDLNLDLDADLPELPDEDGFRDAPIEAEIADADFVEIDEGFQPTVSADQPVLAGLDLPEIEVEDAEISEIVAETDDLPEAADEDQADLPLIPAEAAADDADAARAESALVDVGVADEPAGPEAVTDDPVIAEVEESEVADETTDADETEPQADMLAADEPVAEEPLEAAVDEDEAEAEVEDDLTEAEIEALAVAAAEVAQAEAAAAAQGATVVRHDAPTTYVGKKLNPRAKAVHDRAAKARAQAAQSPVAPQRKPMRSGGRITELAAMIGALIIGLALVWIFLAPGDNPQDVTRQIASNPQRIEDISRPLVVEDSTQASTPEAVMPNGATPSASIEAVIPEGNSAESAAMSSDAAPEAVLPVAPEAVPSQVVTTALSPLERAMVNAAATGPSEAIVAATAAALSRPAQTAVAPAAPPRETASSAPVAPERVQPAPTRPVAAPQQTAAVQVPAPRTPASRAPVQSPPAQAAPAQTAPATSNAAPSSERRAGLTRSARPQVAPRRKAAAPRQDAPPTVPANPLPFEVTQQPSVRPAAVRPPRREARPVPQQTAPAVQPAPQAAAQPAATPPTAAATTSQLRSSSRPPSRPEGSVADFDSELTPAESQHINQLLLDLRRAEAGTRELDPTERRAVFQLAEARPMRRPGNVGSRAQSPSTSGISQGAVDDAVRAASATAPPTDRTASPQEATSPARDSGGLLNSSGRPRAKPGRARSVAASNSNVTEALNEAVASAAPLGGVTLNALTSSNLPPRRKGAVMATAVAAATPTTTPETPAAAPEAPAAAPDAAAVAERRRLDEQLQTQAEARIRARAAADAAAEAQARAQAEARARAQVAAEEQQARRQRQTYRPQELDDEPDVAATTRGGTTAANVAAAATQRRGLDLGRTTIIGIIGAGQASRALIRLRNGKIVTVRLGDRIDGGTINSIGDGRLTYVKAGRTHELRLLDGR